MIPRWAPVTSSSSMKQPPTGQRLLANRGTNQLLLQEQAAQLAFLKPQCTHTSRDSTSSCRLHLPKSLLLLRREVPACSHRNCAESSDLSVSQGRFVCDWAVPYTEGAVKVLPCAQSWAGCEVLRCQEFGRTQSCKAEIPDLCSAPGCNRAARLALYCTHQMS